ncbi:unnamed protein product [Pleuronectes platessa]|uniref:Uncharacterized protein n=1 Tax=Pleuronectes platessa TaxID=8262 RepID=A0A9N7Y706_PLEPL|nr:unnamed protein product [Pleuronectes platessa]
MLNSCESAALEKGFNPTTRRRRTRRRRRRKRKEEEEEEEEEGTREEHLPLRSKPHTYHALKNQWTRCPECKRTSSSCWIGSNCSTCFLDSACIISIFSH